MRPLFAALLFLATSVVFAQTFTREDLTEDPLVALCTAKGDVTAFVYENRDKLTIEQQFKLLRKDWDETWSDQFAWATFVDMNRIINDAYRMSGGKYRRKCCTSIAIEIQVQDELSHCFRYHY